MKLIKDEERTQSILVMQAVIFQPILIMCLKGSSIQSIYCNIQRLLPISDELIKKYLFYLIEYGLINYNGNNKSYFSSDAGVNLLFKIERKKVTEKITTSEILLYLEWTVPNLDQNQQFFLGNKIVESIKDQTAFVIKLSNIFQNL